MEAPSSNYNELDHLGGEVLTRRRVHGADGEFALSLLLNLEYSPIQDAYRDLFERACALNPRACELLWSVAPVVFVGQNSMGRPRTFEICKGGERAIIIPAFDDDGELVDVAAFSVRDAGKCAMHGTSAWMIGSEYAARVQPETDRLLVALDWRAWFIHGGACALFFDYRRAASLIRLNEIRIACENEIARQQLTNLLTVSVMPSVEVLSAQEAA